MVRALLFKPDEASVTQINVDGGLEQLQGLVDGYIEGIYPAVTIPEFEGCHAYVNEEFIYTHPEWKDRPWQIGAYEYLCGPAVFLGSDGAGNEADCPVSVETLLKHIKLFVRSA